MLKPALLVAAVGLLTACHSDSLSLPESRRLSSERVKHIAQTIEQEYPDLSSQKQQEILTLVVRTLHR